MEIYYCLWVFYEKKCAGKPHCRCFFQLTITIKRDENKKRRDRKKCLAVSHSLSSNNNNNIKAVKWNWRGNQTRQRRTSLSCWRKINSTKRTKSFLKTKIRNRFKGIAISVFVVSMNTEKKKILKFKYWRFFWCFGEDIENWNFFFLFGKNSIKKGRENNKNTKTCSKKSFVYRVAFIGIVSWCRGRFLVSGSE